jgi:RNA polymerase sigma-70 factor (ECF subfamily)
MDLASVIARAKQHDKDAFCELVRLHEGMIRGYIARFIGDVDVVFDLAQETFLAAYRRFDTFDQERDLAAWLRGIARFVALHYLRDSGRRRQHETIGLDTAILVWREERLEQESDVSQVYTEELKRCMEKLDASSARVIDLRYFKRLQIKDISDVLKHSEGAIQMTLLRIRQALRKCINTQLLEGKT